MENNLIYGRLSEEVKEKCENIRKLIEQNIVGVARGLPLPPDEMFRITQLIEGFRFYITGALLENENIYLACKEGYISPREGVGMSVAAAEAKAQITPGYRAFRFLRRYDELAAEQLLVIKKFSDRLYNEEKMSFHR